MSSLNDALAQSKFAVAESKQSSAQAVAVAKAGIQQGLTDSAAIGTAVFGRDPKEVVEDRGNIRIHRDGTISVITQSGDILPDVNPDSLQEIIALDRQKYFDRKFGASDNPLIGVANVGVDVLGKIAKGTVSVASNVTGLGKTSQSLREEVDKYNRKAVLNLTSVSGALNRILNKAGDNDIPITDETYTAYTAYIDKVKKGEPLSLEDRAFTKRPEFTKLQELNSNVAESAELFGSIDDVVESVKSYVPTTRADDLAVKLAYDRVAKDAGTWAAIKHTVNTGLPQLLKQGIESTPYMVAFTIGGPITQTALLTALSVSAARDSTAEFIQKNDRDPTSEEQLRINAWSAVATVAEKYGDMAALKALPFAKLGGNAKIQKRINRVMQATYDSLPKLVKGLSSVIFRPAAALAGEGLSGAITSASEQLAQSGEITSTSDIAFDALAEAMGTPGGVATMVAGEAALGIAKGTVNSVTANSRAEQLRETLATPQTVADTPEAKPIQDRIDEINALNENTSTRPMARRLLNVERDQLQEQLNAPAPGAISPEERAEAQRKYDALPSRVKPIPVDISNADTEDSTDIIENASPVENATSTENNLPISPEDFTKITANLSFSKTTLEEDIKALLELNERDLNAEQNDEYIALHAKATEEHNKYIAEISDSSSKKTSGLFSKIFRNIGTAEPLDESSIAELNKIIDSDATPSVVEHAKELLELTEAAVLAAKTMAEVGQEVISGTTTREKGFDTYIAEIDNARDSIANSSDDVEISLARKTIEKALSGIKTHSDNMVRKSKALTSALEAAESTNTPHYVEGNKAENYNWESNREIDYTLVSNENIEENETRFANRDSDYFYKIDNTAESNSLVNAVNNEASYGQKVLNAAISNIKLVTEESQNSDKSSQQLDLLLTNAAPKTTVNKSEVVTGTDLDAVNFSEDNASAARREAAEQGDQDAQNNLDALTETPTKKPETESVAAEQKRSDDLTEPPAKETKTETPTENTDTEEIWIVSKAETPAKETKAETPSPANKTEVSDVDSSATATNAIATSEYAEQLVDLLRNQEATNTTVFDTASDVITKDTEIDSRNDKQIEDNLPKDMANAKDQWLGLLNDIDSINKVIKCMF